MEPECDFRIFRSVGCGLLNWHLIKGELLGAFARNVLKMNRALAQIFQRQGVEVVSATCRVNHVRLQHGVLVNAAQRNAVVGQHVGVILQVLAHFGDVLVFQQWLECLQHHVSL